jgi:hypothetical protein
MTPRGLALMATVHDDRPIDALRYDRARLKREIAYYCGVIARTISRERIQRAHAAIRQRERQLLQTPASATSQGDHDD